MLDRCDGATVPWLRPELAGLTGRERQVAARAARGRTRREISVGLVVSVRTVDNHLASVYRKLGLGGREEFAALLSAE